MSLVYSTLLDAVGTVVSVETVHGIVYTGKLESVDRHSLGVRLSAVMVTLATGMKDVALSVTVPGAEQKFVKLPRTMKLAPRLADVRKGHAGAAGSGSALGKAGKKGANKASLLFGGGGSKPKKPRTGGGGDNKKAKKAI